MMRQILLVIRNGAFAGAIAVGLIFGATQALGGSPDLNSVRAPCTSDPYTCPEPISNCYEWCKVRSYEDGYCYEVDPHYCCICLAK